MVVAVGLTAVEPLAEVDVNVPGVMAMLVAPVVLHARVLLEPDSMLPGLAVKDSIVGLDAARQGDGPASAVNARSSAQGITIDPARKWCVGLPSISRAESRSRSFDSASLRSGGWGTVLVSMGRINKPRVGR
jgi:hypothetical protein